MAFGCSVHPSRLVLHTHTGSSSSDSVAKVLYHLVTIIQKLQLVEKALACLLISLSHKASIYAGSKNIALIAMF